MTSAAMPLVLASVTSATVSSETALAGLGDGFDVVGDGVVGDGVGDVAAGVVRDGISEVAVGVLGGAFCW